MVFLSLFFLFNFSLGLTKGKINVLGFFFFFLLSEQENKCIKNVISSLQSRREVTMRNSVICASPHRLYGCVISLHFLSSFPLYALALAHWAEGLQNP